MGQYYYLVAGLPDLTLDDSKIPFTITAFREELEKELTSQDKKLVDLFFLKFDNKNLIKQVLFPDFDADPRGSITYDEFTDLFKTVKEKERPPRNKHIPIYFTEFFRLYLEKEGEEKKQLIPWEDRLSALYYSYAMGNKNKFVAAWFEFNLNINNLLTAFTARKYGLNRADYIVGDNEVARLLRASQARDFGLDDSVACLPALQRIAEETDLLVREKKTDRLKWEWLDEQTFFNPFNMESVFAYLLKLEMLERWVTLDKATGEETFRKLVGVMKKGSDNTLEEFKLNNEK